MKTRNQGADYSDENVDRSNIRTQQKIWQTVAKDYLQEDHEESG